MMIEKFLAYESERGDAFVADIKIGLIESEFAEIIWTQEPITTTNLVKIASEKFGWKRTTTHTVIKRLCQKGLFVNQSGIVTSLISRDEFFSMQSIAYVENTFKGSLPAFVAAFMRGNKISPEEAAELRRLIDKMDF